ncbi:hypothetical protein [Algoriphagus sp. Y33]|uniref:hypothetical protein n=1 Tax=Algoriphagus sp. Y33 TaxID=2772483 RepID=UPI00177B6322|nr:hypothetical protein [Algoriphagus sp. Y33]
MKEGLIKDAYEALIKELQTIVTIAYVFSVGIGMLFNYQKYIQFNINIFDYADILDFLIAPFSDFAILFFIIGSASLLGLLILLDSYSKKKYPNLYSTINFRIDKKPWFKLFQVISYSLLFGLYLFLAAQLYGSYYKEQVLKSKAIELKFADNEIKKGILIGKTKDILFLLHDNKLSAIPISSFVKEFEIIQD